MIDRNPKYDGRHVYVVDLSKLMPGDVLLTRNAETTSSREKLQSTVISKATRGDFSHAMLCTRPPTFIEAVGHGVSNISAQISFAHDLKNVRLLRYHDQGIADNAGSEALPLLGKKYSVGKAIRSILPSFGHSNVPDDELFCSALVAAVYRKAGAAEFAAIDPMKVTPATLEKAGHFKDETANVFVRILSPNNIESMSALDGDRITSPLGGHAELFQEYCDVLLPMIRKFIDGTPELTFELKPTSFLNCVMFIAAAKNACANLPDAIAEEPRRKIKAIDNAAYNLLTDGRYEAMQRLATANDEESVQYTLTQSFAADPDIDRNATRGLIAATRAQIASRSPGHARNNYGGGSRVADKWFEISDEVVDVLKRRLQGLEESFARAFPGEPF
jgi:hypothetical protein